MTRADIKAQIATQLYTTLERLGADEELLAIVGSMNDTRTDKEVLRMLEEYNRTGNVSRQPQ
jgi:vacuolar-type H+-ATPase subunit B/Vma2